MVSVNREQPKLVASFLWRRLDQSGHDCCRLYRLAAGWNLRGMAVFRESGQPCNFAYEVVVDSAWNTRSAKITGIRGRTEFAIRVRCTADGKWRVGGEVQPSVASCSDIDPGFTPATNMLAIRRLSLRIGEKAEAPAAWLALPSIKLSLLPQTYLRSTKVEYDYEAPTVGYKGRLQISRLGAVVLTRDCSSYSQARPSEVMPMLPSRGRFPAYGLQAPLMSTLAIQPAPPGLRAEET